MFFITLGNGEYIEFDSAEAFVEAHDQLSDLGVDIAECGPVMPPEFRTLSGKTQEIER